MKPQFAAVFELTISDKLQLLEDLWDSIAETPEQLPIYEWQKKELDLRKENYQHNSTVGTSWEIAKQRISQQL
ncbi:addiction module protein [Gloeomargarita lithophora Alchichica-D10]|uniref:Addiction module protein n=1 Tax=Gloeomargarita lithophora Alchichica-D10 TaxID=1188229 RepID=A0A1J0A9K1_9CYAN|nr:addiction module protein [Gloeomargarita lithophora]APB32599.1 addiction module protein [Gloeomargarita lithophora Alchichica-D10]